MPSGSVVPEGMSRSDPSHPDNMQARLRHMSAQAAADTKYDPVPPPRVDAFRGSRRGSSFGGPFDKLLTLLSMAVTAGAVAVVLLANRRR